VLYICIYSIYIVYLCSECMSSFVLLDLVSSVLAQILAGKNIMALFCFCCLGLWLTATAMLASQQLHTFVIVVNYYYVLSTCKFDCFLL